MVKEGQAVTYVDSVRRHRAAVVTHVGIPGREDTWVNLVVTVLDGQEDTYGLKIERFTSVPHHGMYGEAMNGNYWKM